MRGDGHGLGRRLSRCIPCAVLLALGCSVYDPSLIEGGPAVVPDRPPAGTSSSEDDGSIVFALQDIYIRQSAEMAARTGLDLDATATASRDGATCEPRVMDGGQAVVDGRRGIDNSLGTHLLPTVGSALPCLEDNLALTQGRGIGTVVLWIREWNGERNDARVTATLTTAVAGTSEDPSLVGFRGSDPLNLTYLEGSTRNPVAGPAWDAATPGTSTASPQLNGVRPQPCGAHVPMRQGPR